jgi:CDP-diacylglycerol--glycerol-3-phosphate 3-phosphatidyltransferase
MGKALDPVADKLLTSSAFIMLAAHGWVPAWMVCLLVGRELGITGLRSVIAGKGVDISSSRLGKLKTGFQIAAIIPLMIHYPLLDIDFRAIGLVLIWIALGFTVWSGIDYVIKFKRVM